MDPEPITVSTRATREPVWPFQRAGATDVVPSLLRHLNARRVLDALWRLGPVSRADLTRYTGISAPTMSKLVEGLIKAGLLEQEDELRYRTGRPSTMYRLATRTTQIIGAVVDVRECTVVSAGLDGVIDDSRLEVFATPGSYEGLMDQLVESIGRVRRKVGVRALGLGLTVPGLVRTAEDEMILCPNLHQLDHRRPGRELRQRLRMPTAMVQEDHALCLAEQIFGQARGIDHFAMVDMTEGFGMGVVTGGRLITGSQGYGGEIGHMTVRPDGERCGCGNSGCLETVATDRAFARAISALAQRPMTIEEAVAAVRADRLAAGPVLAETLEYLAWGLGAIVNIFNPSLLIVYGRVFDAREGLFEELRQRVRSHSLTPSFECCRIVRAQGSKRLGALACMINALCDALGPQID